MQYFAYPKYQKTGIDWLGDIPEHWEYRKLRYYSKRVSTGTTPTGNVFFEDATKDWFTPSDFDDRRLDLHNSYRKVNATAIEQGEVKLFPAGSVLVIGIGATLGKIGISATEFSCNQQINVIIPDDILDAKFLAYSLQVKIEVMKIISNSTTIGIMNQDKTKLIDICAPYIDEQRIIVEFLNRKTKQIDQLIDKKKTLIDRLEEQRIAVITQAVTKGIDENSNLKPSGVDWLGDVPAHWDVKRLRFSINSNPVKSEVTNYQNDTFVSFVPMDSVSEYGVMDVSQEKLIGEVYSGYTYFKEKDVVIAKITPCFENGKGSLVPALTNDIGFGTTEFHVLRALNNINSEYLFFITISDPFRSIGASEMLGAGGQKRVPENFIKDFTFGVPPIEEQCEIVAFLNEKLSKINNMKKANFRAIEKLEEYRSAIITSAVTGKIDVRSIEIPIGVE